MSLRRVLPVVALVGAAVAALVLAAGSGSDDPSVEARTERLTAQLRCPTCQGLSVADSPSSTARAIADDVRRRVREGESDDEIKAAYVARYGDWILLRPRSSGVAALVWALPVAVLAAAAGALAFAFGRWRREPVMHASDADRELVDRLRGRRPPDGAAGSRQRRGGEVGEAAEPRDPGSPA